MEMGWCGAVLAAGAHPRDNQPVHSSLIALVALLSLPAIVLAWHVWRDLRGGRRNASQRCYACGNKSRTLRPVSHGKGGTYLYCRPCADKEGVKSAVAWIALASSLLIAAAILATRWA